MTILSFLQSIHSPRHYQLSSARSTTCMWLYAWTNSTYRRLVLRTSFPESYYSALLHPFCPRRKKYYLPKSQQYWTCIGTAVSTSVTCTPTRSFDMISFQLPSTSQHPSPMCGRSGTVHTHNQGAHLYPSAWAAFLAPSPESSSEPWCPTLSLV